MSLDLKKPKKYRKAPVTGYRCQFCGESNSVKAWESNSDKCPNCQKEYDAILAQEGDD